MNLIIDRKYYDDCTISRVTFSDFQCWFLELPWLDNAPNISCIPEGQYVVRKRLSPGKGVIVPQYIGVPDRSFIQIHVGNYTRQILGCQLPGDGIKWVDGDTIPDVTNSSATFKKLMSLLPDEFDVVISS